MIQRLVLLAFSARGFARELFNGIHVDGLFIAEPVVLSGASVRVASGRLLRFLTFSLLFLFRSFLLAAAPEPASDTAACFFLLTLLFSLLLLVLFSL